ncbi:shikimate kinase [Clostridium fallax]|uniref:Shikimate kinase n=1 Tax=Clostridium fallax TaxID=1533 RepID=A0A1M4ZKY7_9CLOT|nr:shikimate kinase [Clostridium fallax]SHF18671.1 shikimate kinase [Clostridium fallax]SQB06331.1 shikimate kinase [Clostridium fallax]
MIIYLIGMPGAGKTTIGKKISKEIGYSFLDTDSEIEKIEKKSISLIFEEKGEKYFRDLEKKLVNEKLCYLKDTIVATGGGMPIYNDNLKELKKSGVTIYLCKSLESLLKRKNLGKRPLLKNNIKKNLIEIYNKRKDIYNKADYIIKEDDLDEKGVMLKLRGIINSEF